MSLENFLSHNAKIAYLHYSQETQLTVCNSDSRTEGRSETINGKNIGSRF